MTDKQKKAIDRAQARYDATKKQAEAVCRAYYIDGFGAMIEDYEIYKRSDVYYG